MPVPQTGVKFSNPTHVGGHKRISEYLFQLTKKQADYLGVPPEGPYKPEHYRY